MSFCCTLHPLDPYLALTLEQSIKGVKIKWDYYREFYQQKTFINRITQRLKACMPELLGEAFGYYPEIHLWGRPFIIRDNEPENVVKVVDAYYRAGGLQDVLRLSLDELAKFSPVAADRAGGFQFPDAKKRDLGLSQVIQELRGLYKMGRSEESGLEIPFVLAQLAGLAYPYWFLGNYGISFLEEIGAFTQTPSEWSGEPRGLKALFPGLSDLQEHFPKQLVHQLSTGVYLAPEEVGQLLEIIEKQHENIILQMELKQLTEETAVKLLQKMVEALTYAKAHRFGLLEATDVFDPQNAPFP